MNNTNLSKHIASHIINLFEDKVYLRFIKDTLGIELQIIISESYAHRHKIILLKTDKHDTMTHIEITIKNYGDIIVYQNDDIKIFNSVETFFKDWNDSIGLRLVISLRITATCSSVIYTLYSNTSSNHAYTSIYSSASLLKIKSPKDLKSINYITLQSQDLLIHTENNTEDIVTQSVANVYRLHLISTEELYLDRLNSDSSVKCRYDLENISFVDIGVRNKSYIIRRTGKTIYIIDSNDPSNYATVQLPEK